ncbi:MAG: tetratricopeptide repeat protein [Deltaproteobacteria bacterium]|nr:tetratricopeptide repeat protein [Deltaproteobacteria bacterium]MBW2649285.1 tetratricopeptide repeat protein [Deltaproteobacteria bacterium]
MADKLTKKELEQPDEFHTIGWEIMQYISEHRNRFYAAGVAVLLIIILLGGWYFYRVNYENKAERMYSSAYNSYSLQGSSSDMKDAYLSAVGIYTNLVKEYPGSRAATLSFYNMGNIYFNIGEVEKSIEAYKTFLKRSEKHDILTALAYYGLGYCYEKNKNYNNALKSFENSNRRIQGTLFESINYANMGRIYEKMGRQKEALEFYRKTAQKTNDPLMEMLVKSRIAALS